MTQAQRPAAQDGPGGVRSAVPFRAVNLFTRPLTAQVAHRGTGKIGAVRIASGADLAGAANFIDYVELPPGTSIGDHTHADDEEEMYLVLEGDGLMRLDEERFAVSPGDLVRNRPGGIHGLENTGTGVLRLFVIELAVR